MAADRGAWGATGGGVMGARKDDSAPEPGHNSGVVAGERLRSYVERIERLEQERRELGEDIRDVYLEVKAAGFEVKVVRALIRERREDEAARKERESLLDLYRHALGMLADMPLGEAAIEHAAS